MPGEQTLRRELERNLTSLVDVIANSIDVSYQQAIGEVQYIAAQPGSAPPPRRCWCHPKGAISPPTVTREQLRKLMQPLLRSRDSGVCYRHTRRTQHRFLGRSRRRCPTPGPTAAARARPSLGRGP